MPQNVLCSLYMLLQFFRPIIYRFRDSVMNRLSLFIIFIKCFEWTYWWRTESNYINIPWSFLQCIIGCCFINNQNHILDVWIWASWIKNQCDEFDSDLTKTTHTTISLIPTSRLIKWTPKNLCVVLYLLLSITSSVTFYVDSAKLWWAACH